MRDAGSYLPTALRDLFACAQLASVSYLAYAYPHRELDTPLAIAGGVTLLHSVMSTLQEYRSRDAHAIALSQRRRIRVPGPQ